MSRRRLTPEEVALWREVAQRTERLHKPRPTGPEDAPVPRGHKPKPKPQRVVKTTQIAPFQIGAAAPNSRARNDLSASPADHLRKQPISMDAKTHARIKRGKKRPEARIDLHGMTRNQAEPALTEFILRSHQRGLRLVLVITGKGREDENGEGPIPTPRGVLRQQVPHWLGRPALSRLVQQVMPAHISHGGDGAYYVYLSRGR